MMRRASSTWLLFAWTCLRAHSLWQSRDRSVTSLGSLQVEKSTHSGEPLVQPARVNATAAQADGACVPPFMAGNSMYLTAMGSSISGGQWGAWQLSDDPDSPSTTTWKLDFMAPDWQTLRFSSDSGHLSAVTKPMAKAELEKQYGWVPATSRGSDGFGEQGWEFMEDLRAPAIAFTYDSLNFSNNYSVAKDPDSYPPTLTASPSLREATMDPSKWRYWVATDCQDALAAVFRVEVTEGQRPGRIIIYNKDGEIVTQVLADPVVARYEFLDINKRLLAVAESPALGAGIPMMSLPRRSNIGNILPYTVHFERGGYNLSSSLLKQELRWIIGSAVQVRALQDAHTDFVPPFIKDRYLLLAIVLALILIAAVLVISVLTGSLRSASRIFFYRDKASQGIYAPPAV